MRDFFKKIEITWSLHNTGMHQSAIHEYMVKHEEDDMPSVLDMVQNLHAYEQSMIDAELYWSGSKSEVSLLALRRVKTDIRQRDITLKDVPGLQFVIERPIAKQQSQEYDQRTMQRHSASPICTTGYGSRSSTMLEYWQMQLMQREQQSRKRMLMARQEQDTFSNLPQNGEHRMPGGLVGLQTALASFDMSIESPKPDELPPDSTISAPSNLFKKRKEHIDRAEYKSLGSRGRKTGLSTETPMSAVSHPVGACRRCRAAQVECEEKLPACTDCERAERSAECSRAIERAWIPRCHRSCGRRKCGCHIGAYGE